MAAVAACRACLLREGEVHIFHEPCLLRKLQACVPLQIDIDDGLPNCLCKVCMANLDRSYNFQQLCVESDLSLRQGFLKNDYEIKFEVEEPAETEETPELKEQDVLFVPVKVKKELVIDNYCHLTNILEKIELNGEINIKPVKAKPPTKTKKRKLGKNSNRKQISRISNETLKTEAEIKSFITKREVKEPDKYVAEVERQENDDAFLRGSSMDRDVFDLFRSNEQTLDVVYTCNFCNGQSFNTLDEQSDHINMHKKETYECEVCKKTLKGRIQIEIHKEKHVQRMYVCDICGKLIKKHIIARHIRSVHKRCTSHECDVCHKILRSKLLLMRHKNLHVDPPKLQQCTVCSKKVKFMDLHMITHSGKKPFKCQICGSAFTIRKSLVEHERLHSGVTPYKCPVCEKGFAQRCNMKSHFKHNHRDHNFKEAERKFKELKF